MWSISRSPAVLYTFVPPLCDDLTWLGLLLARWSVTLFFAVHCVVFFLFAAQLVTLSVFYITIFIILNCATCHLFVLLEIFPANVLAKLKKNCISCEHF